MMALAAVSAFLGLAGPVFQKFFLDRLSHSPSILGGSEIDFFNQIPLLALLTFSFVSLLLSLVCYQAVIYLGTRESVWMQRKFAQALFDRNLHLRVESLHGRSIGDVVSVYTTDVPGSTILLEQCMPQGLGILFPFLLGPWVLIHFFAVPAHSLILFFGVLLVFDFSLALR